jgi:hypothetical protein
MHLPIAPDRIKKVSPVSGIKLICGPGPKVTDFYIDGKNIKNCSF